MAPCLPVSTYVRTVTLDAWAETRPWDCLVNPDTRCASTTHNHSPMVGDRCAVPECREPLLAGERCYYVIQLPRDPFGHEQAVCWRHIRPAQGPLQAAPAIPGPGVVAVTSGCGMSPCGHPGCLERCVRR